MRYICPVLECASIAIIAGGLEKGRRSAKVRELLIYLAVYLVFFAVGGYFNLGMQISAASYILLFIYLKLAYKEEIVHTLAVTVLSAVFTGIIEILLAYVIGLGIVRDAQEAGAYVAAVTGTTFVSALGLSRVNLYRILDVLEKWDFTYAAVCILSLMIFAPLAVVKAIASLDIQEYVYIAVCIVVMWLLVMKVQQYKIDAKIRRQYYEAYKDVLIQIRRRQHKIKNQINAAYSMFRIYDTYDELVEKQKQYLAKILHYELPNDAIVLEEPSVIALIYEKINEAAECGIQMHTSFSCSIAGSRVADMTWVDLIGTLFDNAIEALAEYDGEKRIWFEIGYAGKNRISMKITNTFHKLSFHEINQFFELGYSTKGNGRGVGLYNVKQIVHKNRGEISAMSMEKDGLPVLVVEITI